MTMEDFILATASTCDLDKEWLDSHHIFVLPYSYEIDGVVYEDDNREESRRSFYAQMREDKLPNTSQITTFAYIAFFKELLGLGKPVVFVDMDKSISNSYANSLTAYDQIMEENPDAKLYIVDSRCITIGLSLLLKVLLEKRDAGENVEDVVAWANENGPKVAHRFFVDDLKWLQRGGRLSNAAAMVGTLLSIKPLIYLDVEGLLVAYDKCHGKKKAIKKLLDDCKKDIHDGDEKDIIVCYADDKEEGLQWQELVAKTFPKATSITLQEVGPTIGAHVGPGIIGIVYFTDERKP